MYILVVENKSYLQGGVEYGGRGNKAIANLAFKSRLLNCTSLHAKKERLGTRLLPTRLHACMGRVCLDLLVVIKDEKIRYVDTGHRCGCPSRVSSTGGCGGGGSFTPKPSNFPPKSFDFNTISNDTQKISSK